MQVGKNYLNINFTSNDSICLKKQQQRALSSTYAAFLPVYYNNKEMQTSNLSKIFKSYALINEKSIGYKELKTFKAPYIGEGKIYELDNGHKVVILPKPGPTVVNTYVKVGSLNDPPGVQGISHLLEHYIAGRADKYKSINGDDSLHSIGVKSNAGTSNSYTQYEFKSNDCDEKKLEKIIEISSKMLASHDFDKKLFDKEKEIVISESKTPVELSSAFKEMAISKFFLDKPIKNANSTGDEESVKNITEEKLMKFYNTWYAQDNMSTVIVGEVDPAKTIKTFAKNFNKINISEGEQGEKFYQATKKDSDKPNVIEEEKDSANVITCVVGYVGPKNNDLKGKVVLDALTFSTSGIFQPMLFSNSPSVPQFIYSGSICNSREIENEYLSLINDGISFYSKSKLSDKEMRAIKLKLKKEFIKLNENSLHLTDLIGQALVANGDISGYTNYLKTVKSLTSEDLKDFAKNYLDPSKQQKYVVRPKSEPREVKLNNKVSFHGDISKIKAANAKKYNLSNNLYLILDSPPNVSLSCGTFKLIPDRLIKSKPGTFEVLQDLLKFQYFTKSVDKAIDLNLGLTKEGITLNFNCLPEVTPDAIEIVKSVFNKTRFDVLDFLRIKEETKSNLLSKVKNIAKEKALDKLNEDNPYYKDSSKEILKNIDMVTLKDVKSLYNVLISNSKMNAIITLPQGYGQKKESFIVKSLNKELPSFKKFKNAPTKLPLLNKKNIVITDASFGSGINILRLFKVDKTQNVKDDASLEVLNFILGNGKQSRLFNEIREKSRIAYDVNSQYYQRARVNELHINLYTQADNLKDNSLFNNNLKTSLESIENNLKLLASQSVSKEELKAAKISSKNYILENQETSSGRNNLLSEGLNTDYGVNYINKKLKAIEELKSQDIQEAAKRIFSLPSVTLVQANKQTIKQNRGYLSGLGEILEVSV